MLGSMGWSNFLHPASAHRPTEHATMKPAPQPVPVDAAATGSVGPGWRSELVFRMRTHFALKLIGVTGFIWLFFIAYFYLLRHPARPVTEMALTALDDAISFQPLALGAYVSLWLYVGIAPGLMRELRELVVYGLWAAALCGVGLGAFYLWPTAVPKHALDGAIDLLQGIDAAGNACPSLHVATAVFSMAWIERTLRVVRAPLPMRLLNALWFVAIAYSTLAIKQHVVLDVMAGLVLGLAFAFVSLRWQRRGARGRIGSGWHRPN